MKESGSFKQKYGICERLIYFQIVLVLKKTYPISTMATLKTITTIYSNEQELKKESGDPCKGTFLDLSIEVYAREFTTV